MPAALIGSRPGLKATAALTKGVCTGKELPAYLGADTYDEPAFVNIWTRVPTPGECARGDRMVRCDVVPAAAGGVLPSIDTSLRGIMRTHRGDAFHPCFDGSATVPCSAPHTAEHVRSLIPIPSGIAPDQIPRQWAVASCSPLVSEFLGQDVGRTSYRIEAFAYPNVTRRPRNAGLEVVLTQTCVVHLLRNSFRYAGRQHRDAIAKVLKPVYTPATARERFGEFAQAWGAHYPAIVRLWDDAWPSSCRSWRSIRRSGG